MYILILLLVALGIVAAIIALCSKHGDDTILEKATCSTCNSENQKCEQECMMEAATKPIEYYDDEELYTMREEEVAGWCRSLHLRGINLPDQLKDEVYAFVS